MKRILLLIFAFSGAVYGQLPELMYYKFDGDSSNIINNASSPVGNSKVSISGTLNVSSGSGFQASNALSGTGASYSYISTGWPTQLNGSWTIGFWLDIRGMSTGLHYLFGDNTASFYAFTGGTLAVDKVLIGRGSGNPGWNRVEVSGFTDGPHYIHCVYDAGAGTLSAYKDGALVHSVSAPVNAVISGDDFKLGNYLNTYSSAGLEGLLDEFRLYNRALASSEITNTWNQDLLIAGNCNAFSNFGIDSLASDAARFQWEPGSGNTSYYLEYGLQGFTPGTGNMLSGTYPNGDSTVLIGGLTTQLTYDVYFTEICNSGNDSSYLPSPFTFTTPKPCATPSGFNDSAVTSLSVDLYWDPAITGTPSYNIIYGRSGFDPTLEGTVKASVTNPYTLSGLNGNIEYDVYLVAYCGSDGYSDTIGPVSFITMCGPTVGPYYNSFDETATGSMVKCWSSYISTGTGELEVTGSGGPLEGKHLAIEGGAGVVATDTVMAISPEFTDMPAGDKWLRFHARTNNTSSGIYVGTADTSGGTITFNPLDTIEFSSNDSYREYRVKLTTEAGYNGTDRHFAFRHSLGGVYHTVYLDNVSYEAIPSCVSPYEPEITNVTFYSAELSFGSDSTVFQFEHGVTGFVPGQGQGFVGYGSNPLMVYGLASETTYDVYIRTDCNSSGNGFSEWKGPFSFTTFCLPVSAPFSESFSSGSMPDCWYTYNENSTSSNALWKFSRNPTGGASSNGRAAGTFAWSDGSSPYVAGVALETPFIDISTLSVPMLYFELFSNNDHATNTGRAMFQVDMWDGTNWIENIFHYNANSPDWQEIELLLDEYASGNLVKFRFVVDKSVANPDSRYHDILLDSVSVREAPPCPKPRFLEAENITADQATIRFTAMGHEFNFEWGPSGFGQGTGTIDTTYSESITLSMLNPLTHYDVYLRNNCSDSSNGLSPWVGPFSFRTACEGSLSGQYTIDRDQPKGGRNFNNFQQAAEALNVCGISGPVVFDIKPGTYTGNLQLSDVSGVSAVNTILFEGSGEDTLIWNGEGKQATVVIDSTAHVRLRKMRIVNNESSEAFGILITHNSDSVFIDSCTVVMDETVTSGDLACLVVSDSYINDMADGADVDYLRISNSTFRGGVFGISIMGNGTDNPTTGHYLLNNRVLNFYDTGIRLDDQENIRIEKNEIETSRYSYSSGMNTFNLNNFAIEGNKVDVPYYGIRINNSFSVQTDTAFLANNMVISANTSALELSNVKNAGIYFNTVQGEPGINVNGFSPTDIRNNIFTSTSDFAFEADQEMELTDSLNFNVYHSAGTTLSKTGSSSYTDLASWQTAKPAFNRNSGEESPVFLDARDLHMIAGVFIDNMGVPIPGISTDIDGEVRSSLTPDIGADEFSTPTCLPSTGLGINNVSATTAELDWNNGSGISFRIEYGPSGFTPGSGSQLSGITPPYTISGLSPETAYDFYVQDSCEYSLSGWSAKGSFVTACSDALNGIYTIDPAQATGSTNFSSIAEALDRLNDCGISGPVTINIAEGTYNDSILLKDVFGTSPTSKLVLQADPANTGPVVIQRNASHADGNYVLRFQGSSFISIRGLRLTSLGSSYSRVVEFKGNCDNITLENNVMNGNVAGSSSDQHAVIYNDDAGNVVENTIIKSNTINHGSEGIHWQGDGTNMENGNFIEGNSLSGFYAKGISIKEQGQLVIKGNSISTALTSASNNVYGIESYESAEAVIDSNQVFIEAPSGAFGIYSYEGSGTRIITNKVVVRGAQRNYGIYNYLGGGLAGSHALIGNNMISALDNSGVTYGILNSSSAYTDIVYNSVLVNAGAASSSYGISISGLTAGNSMSVINNNVINTGGGVALTIDPSSTVHIDTIDYNNWYSSGAVLAEYGNIDAVDLSAWISASGMDSNSVSTDPAFAGPEDLHITSVMLNDAGKPYIGILKDIDGEIRSSSTPDIGADEFAPLADDLSLTAITEPLDQSCGDSNTVISVIIQNQGIQTVSSFDMKAIISGSIDDTLSMNYSSPLGSAGRDTVRLSAFNSAGGGAFHIEVFVEFPADQNRNNDTVSVSLELQSILMPKPIASTTEFCPGTYDTLYFPQGSTEEYLWLSASGDTLGSADSLVVGPLGANDTSFALMATGGCPRPKGMVYLQALPVVSASFSIQLDPPTATTLLAGFDASASGGTHTYHWDFGDGTTRQGGAAVSHTYTSNGQYTVQLIAEGDCGRDTITDTVVVTGISLMENSLNSNIELYPNPVSGDQEVVTLNIETGNSSEVNITILDIRGKQVKHIVLNDINGTYSGKVDMTPYAPGTYVIRIENEGKAVRRKIVKY